MAKLPPPPRLLNLVPHEVTKGDINIAHAPPSSPTCADNAPVTHFFCNLQGLSQTRDCLFQGRSWAILWQGISMAEQRIVPHMSRRGAWLKSCFLLPYLLTICSILVLNHPIFTSPSSPSTVTMSMTETTKATHQTMKIIIPRPSSPSPPLHACLNKEKLSQR